MAEELQLNVKTNIKSATQDTKEYVSELEKAQTGVSDLSENLKLQDKVIRDLENAVQALELKLIDTPKAGASGWTELNNALKKTKIELKGEKDAVKELKAEMKEAEDQLKKVETATDGVKTSTKELKTETEKYIAKVKENRTEMKGLIDNFGAFGITIGNIKKKFKEVGLIMKTGLKFILIQSQAVLRSFQLLFSGKMVRAAKLLFTTIRMGMVSTGVGALVVAFGSLVTWFMTTKAGAETLQKVFAGLGAAIGVIVDRISKFGSAIMSLFSGGGLGAFLEEMRAVFKGAGRDIIDATKEGVRLKGLLQDLADAERNLTVETAKKRAEIEKLKKDSQDITKTEQERIIAAQKAFDLENEIEAKRVVNAEEAVRLEKARHALLGERNVQAKDLDKLAELEINLSDIQRESGLKLIRLNNTKNKLLDEAARKTEEAAQKEKAIADQTISLLNQVALLEEKEGAAREALRLKQAEDKEIALANEIEDLELQEERKQAIKDKYALLNTELENETLMNTLTGMALELQTLEDNYKERRLLALQNNEDVTAMDEQFTADKAKIQEKYNKKVVKWSEMSSDQQLDIASQTAGNMASILGEQTAAGKAMAIVQTTIDTYKSATAAYSAMAGIPYVGPALGAIAAGAAVAAGLKNVQAILSTDESGTSAPSPTSAPSATATAPAPQMVGGQFQITNPVPEQDPIKAFVVTDEMTNSQDQLANIRRRATI